MIGRYTIEVVIRAMHSLQNPDVSDSENERLYGMCFRLHGHSYKFRLTLESEIDPQTSCVRGRVGWDSIVERELKSRWDGKNLNDLYPNTSGEALILEAQKILQAFVPPGATLKVALQETRKNYFELPA